MLLSAPVQAFRLEGRKGGGSWGFYLFIGRFSASSPLHLCEEGRGLEAWIPPPQPAHTHTIPPSPMLAVFPPSGDTPASVHINIHQSMVLWRGTSLYPTELHIHACNIWERTQTRATLTLRNVQGKRARRNMHIVAANISTQHFSYLRVTHSKCLSHPTAVSALSGTQIRFCLYTALKLDMFPDVWVTQVQLSPVWSVGIFEEVWTSIWRLSWNRRRREKTKGKFLRVKAEIVHCADSSRLCVKLCEAVGSLVISLRSQNGRGAETRAGWERHIINQECFLQQSADSIKSHSFPHTGVTSPSLNCCVKKMPSFVEGTHPFLVSRPNRNSFNIFLAQIFENFQILMLVSKIGLFLLGLHWCVYVCVLCV